MRDRLGIPGAVSFLNLQEALLLSQHRQLHDTLHIRKEISQINSLYQSLSKTGNERTHKPHLGHSVISSSSSAQLTVTSSVWILLDNKHTHILLSHLSLQTVNRSSCSLQIHPISFLPKNHCWYPRCWSQICWDVPGSPLLLSSHIELSPHLFVNNQNPLMWAQK